MTDSEYIQQLIENKRGGEAVIGPVNPRTGDTIWMIDREIVLSSGDHVVLDGCTLRLCDGVFCNIFISADAWKIGDIPAQHDISVCGRNGAVLDGGNYNGLCEKNSEQDGMPHILRNSFFLMRNVSGFKISGLKMINLRYWAVTFFYCTFGQIENIVFDADSEKAPNLDGIDLRVGCHNIEISDITGITGDDTVALTAYSGKSSKLLKVSGLDRDIYNVVIRGVYTACSGGHGIIRLLNQDGIHLYNILIEDVYDRTEELHTKPCYATIRIGDGGYFTERRAEKGETFNITIDKVRSFSKCAVLLGSDATVNLQYHDVENVYGEIVKCKT